MVLAKDLKNFLAVKDLPEFTILGWKLEIVDNGTAAEAQFLVLRRSGYHVTNTFLQMTVLLGIGFLSFLFDIEDFTDRIMVTLTTMLVVATLTASVQTVF